MRRPACRGRAGVLAQGAAKVTESVDSPQTDIACTFSGGDSARGTSRGPVTSSRTSAGSRANLFRGVIVASCKNTAERCHLCSCLRMPPGRSRSPCPWSNRARRRDLVFGQHSEDKIYAPASAGLAASAGAVAHEATESDAETWYVVHTPNKRWMPLPAGLAVPQREPLPMGRPSQTLRPGMWSTLRSKDLYTGLWRSGGFSRSPCPWSHRARPRDLVCGAHSEQKMDAPACGCCAASAGTLAHGATEPDAETWNSVDTPKPRQPVAPPPATSLLMPAKAQLFLLVYSDTPESNCLHIHRRRFCARNP